MTAKDNSIACFGEVLWDIFPPNNKQAGGAPFNVAYHLNKMHTQATMISSVGKDSLGHEILEKIKNWGISTQHIQVDSLHPTSTVIAHIDENNEAHYDILEQVAWDFIELKDTDKALLQQTKAFVFGSLAARAAASKNTLFELVEASSFNVFDVNLRPPHSDIKTIKELLHKTQLAKFNKAELKLVLSYTGKEYTTEKDALRYLQDIFDLQEIIVSKGSKGALYAKGDAVYRYPAVPVTVADTVGSGDSFLAGFLSKRFQTEDVHETMLQAICLGAFITSKFGACPDYTYADFEGFKALHKAIQPLPF